jgi:hypothetical protein
MNAGDLSPATTAAPAAPTVADRSRAWTPGRISSLVIGVLLVLISLVLLGAGGTGVWADRTQRDAGYVTTDVHRFSTAGAALVTEPTHLGSPGVGWLYAPGLLGNVRIRVTPQGPGSALFVGIARTADVDRYLAGVNHTVVSDFFGDKVQVVDGGRPGVAPARQHFWVASASGAGARSLVWRPSNGTWTVVVMNADGRPGIDADTDLGARMPAVIWIALGTLAAGFVFLAGGGLLIAGALRRRAVGAADDRRRSDADH